MFKTELHIHTAPVSNCAKTSAEAMVEDYAKNGYSTIVITNHFTHGQFGDISKSEALERYFDDFLKAKEAGNKEGIRNPSKYMLYNDCLQGLLDCTVNDGDAEKYVGIARSFNRLAKHKEWGYLHSLLK